MMNQSIMFDHYYPKMSCALMTQSHFWTIICPLRFWQTSEKNVEPLSQKQNHFPVYMWECMFGCVLYPPQWEQQEGWASSCPGHSSAGSCAVPWGRSSAHNPGNTRSLDSAPCGGRWSLWWIWGRWLWNEIRGKILGLQTLTFWVTCTVCATLSVRIYGLYLRIVLAACRLCWALLLARIPLHHAWMKMAAKHITNNK